MGYYTRFSLNVSELNKRVLPKSKRFDEFEIIKDLRDTNENAEYCLEEDGSAAEGSKWYEWQEELVEFSKKYPNALFEMSGEGEESGDIWKAYILNGKSQICKVRLVFDEFDLNKLE